MPLPPLAWRPDHPVVLCGDELHRPDCRRAGIVTRELAAGETLWRLTAPTICGYCRPSVELRLGVAA